MANYITSLNANFVGKASLFKAPFGFIFRKLGGAPIERSKSANKVQSIVSIFNERDAFKLGMSPKGTRKKIVKWKTGFYYIAKGANVPIVMATLDFKNKQIKIAEPYYLSNDKEKDFKHFHSFFKGVVGKHPELT
jgi:1-acyl-sn-glycerol-3-phosphate acyltransferase